MLNRVQKGPKDYEPNQLFLLRELHLIESSLAYFLDTVSSLNALKYLTQFFNLSFIVH